MQFVCMTTSANLLSYFYQIPNLCTGKYMFMFYQFNYHLMLIMFHSLALESKKICENHIKAAQGLHSLRLDKFELNLR